MQEDEDEDEARDNDDAPMLNDIVLLEGMHILADLVAMDAAGLAAPPADNDTAVSDSEPEVGPVTVEEIPSRERGTQVLIIRVLIAAGAFMFVLSLLRLQKKK